LKKPGLATRVLHGELSEQPIIHAPPLLKIASAIAGSDPRLELVSGTSENRVQIYGDDRPLRRVDVTESAAEIVVPEAHLGYDVVSAFAIDSTGIVSAPISFVQQTPPKRRSKLFAFAVGVDQYPLLPAQCGITQKESCNLKFAASDASRVIRAVSQSPLYEEAQPMLLIDAKADPAAILDVIDRVVLQAQPEDTIVAFFAGHGINVDGHLFLGLSTTLPDLVEPTSLSFEVIADRLKASKARVIVLLDVCHAGLSDQASVATNDDAVARLVTDHGASMVVFAASKGPQSSQESDRDGGSRFSVAFDTILTSKRATYDANADGAISITELYRGLKSIVGHESAGAQIPWLARNLLVGDVKLF
jgi:hypothetical protein